LNTSVNKRRICFTLIVVFMLSVFTLRLLAQSGQTLSGSWLFQYVQGGEEFAPERMNLTQSGDSITGMLNDLTLKGHLQDGLITFAAIQPDGSLFGSFTGQLSDRALRGTFTRGTEKREAVLLKLPELDVTPQTRVFVPTNYSRLFDGRLTPVMHINSGDTVKTTTIDAAGYDEKGDQKSMGGNPQTGPFYIDGAAPGDTLAVTIVHLHLNRGSARSDSRLAPNVLTPFYFREQKLANDISGDWKLDIGNNQALLEKPTPKLKNFRIDLHPMLGCLAVAPSDKQAFRTSWLGPWGGNMDYNRLTEGTTVFLPVFQEGALLFLGDAHAMQGDGEDNGNALETSMSVEFKVKVIPSTSLQGPRAENDQYLMAMGIAGSLQDALKSATSELAQWLESEYHLNANEAAIVIGTSVHYDIAEVVDPQVNVVARISKAALAQIQK
jgi:amidase